MSLARTALGRRAVERSDLPEDDKQNKERPAPGQRQVTQGIVTARANGAASNGTRRAERRIA